MSIERIQPGAWNSRAVTFENIAYLSGIVPDDKTADMKGQTADVLAKIDAILAEVGSDKNRILSAVVYISDQALKDQMNEAWMAWMDPGHPPVRACVGVGLTKDVLVEIMVTAAL
ncbi:MAG: RidA family protein [Rhodospirillales bacterium]|jgi:enamine deaminase RidA (YjgF/YER057c/UK114 family)